MAELRRGPRPTDAAIVGMGAVLPGAPDLAAFRRNLLAGTDAITTVPSGRWDPEVYYDAAGATGPAVSDRFYCRRGGFVDGLATFDPTRFGIMPTAVDGAEPDQMLALHATAEAIADAGGEDRLPADRSRIGVVLGRGGFMGVATARLDQRVRTAHQLAQTLRELAPELGERRIAAVRAAFQEALGPERPDASIGLVPSFTAARTANRLDLCGPAYTLDAACASSLLAVDQAVGLLAGGRCDLVVAGAVHHCHIATLWSVFTQLRALSPSERIRPFDRRADGTLLSEGTGIVLLKRLADAERDGDRVYAVIRGTGVAGDGRAASLMSPLPEGQVRALERAWREAGLDPRAADALGLLEAHGTGTPVGDAAELDTLARVFGPASAAGAAGAARAAGAGPGGSIGLGSVKSMLGHTMQASGMAGLIKAALAVHEGVLLPTLHVDEPHPDLARTRMRPVTVAEPWERGGAPRRAGVNAFGFGGINAHAILEEAPSTAARPAPARRFLPLGGTGQAPDRASASAAAPAAGVLARGERVLLLTAPDPATLARRLAEAGAAEAGAEMWSGSDADGPCRLAVVGPTPQRLALAAKVVARGTPWRGRGDVWFGPKPLLGPAGGGRVAVLFPGLEPEFAPAVGDVAERLGLAAPALTRGTALVERALDAIGAGRFFASALRALGIEADLLAGHSVGEWAAMVAAGMYPTEAVDAFLDSLRPGAIEVPDLVYAALGCGADRAGAALRGRTDVVVSHDNCPHQSVVCGTPAAVAEVLARLRGEGVLGQELPFRSGFHTPMWEPYLGQVRRAFGRLPLTRPALPVWSATTGAPYPESPHGIRDLIVRHLVRPVDFRRLTLRLHEDAGVRAFVSAGPGSLTGFVEDTLRGREHLAVATSAPRLTGLAALRCTAAALWAEGLDPDWARLAPAPPAATGATPEPPRRRPGVPLDLGSPLVRLSPETVRTLGGLSADRATPPVHRATPPVPRPVRPVLLSALDADPEDAPAQPPAPPERSPAVGRRTLRLSLAELPCVRDHCVYLQPEHWPEDSDRFPVVPMTTMLELAAGAVRHGDRDGHGSGHGAGYGADPAPVTVVGYDDVRALRWLVVEPAVDLEVSTRVLAPGRVRVRLGDCADLVVLTAPAHPAPPPATAGPVRGERPAPVSAEALYRDRWMFHGPQFAGVHEVTAVGEDGIRGVLRALPAPGALLDAAGQLFGHWMQLRLPVDRLVFPATVDRIRLYGPPPAPGTLLHATARIREVRRLSVRGDVELRLPDGSVWAAVDGWTYRRFAADERVWPMKFTPEVCGIGEPRPEGWCVAHRRWTDPASQELVMRRYLGAGERAVYDGLSPRARNAWLLGRIAAKDALRRLLWDRGAGPVFPVEVPVGADAYGRPVPQGPLAQGFRLSLAHKDRVAVALAHPTEPVGIDVETVTADPGALLRVACGPGEAALAEELAATQGLSGPAALTALWCVKEAAAKAAGTGLGGRPRDWRVTAGPEAGALRVVSPEGTARLVRTTVLAAPEGRPGLDHVVAWTAVPAARPVPLMESTHGI
ncbi:type I polyketide synthase [Streptomyces sp. WAC06614]|uniref:type I polyketide synthase n=1 Tax=Streptomyces sp. WAC06614 TaxID=2487416 RepID=UPI000F774163|nr:type I polyketide synthase [Streptomyces sp. WAC06614]RSS68925.1 acyltransferase domain-containing protein [Streptomyces sp. WAC06614]